MAKILIIIQMLLVLLVSCRETKRESANGQTIYVTKYNEASQLSYSEVFKKVKPVCLETNDNILIKRITKLKYFRSRIYILDVGTQSVFCFDETGKFMWKINDLGGAPNEYTQLFDFDINETTGKIYLFSRLEKILVYDLNGKFVERQPFNYNAVSACVNHDEIYMYTGNIRFSTEPGLMAFSLLVKNNETQQTTAKIPLKDEEMHDAIYTFESSNAFCKIGDEIRFFMPFSNRIYSAKGDSVYVRYTFDFGEYNMPENYFKNYNVEDLKNSKYMYGLNSYWENGKYCSFGVNYNQKNYWNVIYSKKEDKMYFSFLDDLTGCFPTISYVDDNLMIGYRNVDDLASEYENLKTNENESNQKKALGNILSSIPEDGNPVLFFCYFK